MKTITVKDVMVPVSEYATVSLVIGHHQSLLVVRGNEITGILRLTDVFQAVSGLVKSCKE